MNRILNTIGDAYRTIANLHTVAKLRLASLAMSVVLTLVFGLGFGAIIGAAARIGPGFELPQDIAMAYVVVAGLGAISWSAFAYFMATPIRRKTLR